MKKVEGIVIAKRPYSEADEVITVLTKDHGKIMVRARGVKKSGAKLAGGLQFLNWLNLFFVAGRGFSIATDTVVKESFSSVKNSVEKLSAASVVCFVIERIIPLSSFEETQENSFGDIILWEQILAYMSFLEEYSGKESLLSLGPAIFIYQMLNVHGFRPSVLECAVCGQKIKEGRGASFSPSAGGVIDGDCLEHHPSAMPVSKGVILTLDLWRKEPIDKIIKKEWPQALLNKTTKIIERFGEWHLGIQLNLYFAGDKIANKV